MVLFWRWNSLSCASVERESNFALSSLGKASRDCTVFSSPALLVSSYKRRTLLINLNHGLVASLKRCSLSQEFVSVSVLTHAIFRSMSDRNLSHLQLPKHDRGLRKYKNCVQLTCAISRFLSSSMCVIFHKNCTQFIPQFG